MYVQNCVIVVEQAQHFGVMTLETPRICTIVVELPDVALESFLTKDRGPQQFPTRRSKEVTSDDPIKSPSLSGSCSTIP